MSRRAIELSVSAISTSPSNFFLALDALPSGSLQRIHVDVMDGVFVPRLGMYPEFVNEIRSRTDLPIDVHMMMLDPTPYFRAFADAGATRLVPHLEPLHHVHRAIDSIHQAGVEAGLAINPHTGLGDLDYIVSELQSVTLMAINPGIVGHQLIPNCINKLRDLRDLVDQRKSDVVIEVDGGITFDNISKVAAAGADLLVVGAGTVFHPSSTVSKNMERLNEMGRTGL